VRGGRPDVSGRCTGGSAERLPPALEERIHLLDGRVSAAQIGGDLVLRADVPGHLRAVAV
jgi:hypothetical protein